VTNRLTISLLTLFGLLLAGPVYSQDNQPLQTVVLKDGTVLKGHLLSVSGDTYVIRTGNLGDIDVNAANVQSISAGNPAPAVGAAPMMGNPGMMGMGMMGAGGMGGAMNPASVNMMATSMMGDPQVSALLQEMTSDPEMMQLMQDPAFMQAMMSMNSEALQNDPRFQKLLSNPKMQNLINVVGQKMIPGQTQP